MATLEQEHVWLKALVKADGAGMRAAEEKDGKQTHIEVLGYPPSPACGFAWVSVKPGTSAFAKFLVKKEIATPSSMGGVRMSIDLFGQDYALKLAYARACADKLTRELVLTQVEPHLIINAGGMLD
ncbi:MAG: hypothetical protein KAJ73_05230 [Zetaproteobacteria bacterium]|nr:hypothetical protein [Zetaproteobacteria bacterium]